MNLPESCSHCIFSLQSLDFFDFILQTLWFLLQRIIAYPGIWVRVSL